MSSIEKVSGWGGLRQKSADTINRMYKVAGTVAVAFFVASSSGFASEAGYDSAADGAYVVGENFNGLNGGSGFGEWLASPAANTPDQGVVIGDSNTNGDQGGPRHQFRWRHGVRSLCEFRIRSGGDSLL
jgi:hypothetical protein